MRGGATRGVREQTPRGGLVYEKALNMLSLRPPSGSLVLLVLLSGGCAVQAPDAPSSKAATRSSALAKPMDVPEAVGQLSSRSPQGREVVEGSVPGSRLVRIRDGYAEVVIARSNPDGTVSTRCVDSAEDARAFLEGTSDAASAPRADR
jgi:hypothetical protein